MHLLPDLQHVTALSAIAIFVLGTTLFTSVLYLHRWLSKLAGHTTGPSPTVRHIP